MSEIPLTVNIRSAKYFAYAKHKSGSDWKSIHIKDVDTGIEFDEVLEWVRFSGIAWTHDDKVFFKKPKIDISEKNLNKRDFIIVNIQNLKVLQIKKMKNQKEQKLMLLKTKR